MPSALTNLKSNKKDSTMNGFSSKAQSKLDVLRASAQRKEASQLKVKAQQTPSLASKAQSAQKRAESGRKPDMAIIGENQHLDIDEFIGVDPASKHLLSKSAELKDEVVYEDGLDYHDRYVKIAEKESEAWIRY